METNIPKLGRTAQITNRVSVNQMVQELLNDRKENPSYSSKRMNSALFKILCDLKESQSEEPPARDLKLNHSLLVKAAHHHRLDRMLENEQIFRKGSESELLIGQLAHLLPYKL